MNNKIVIRNREPQEIKISGGGEVIGITNVYVNGIDVTEGSAAYVIVPTKLSELENNMHFISEEVDPTVPYYVKQITQADINKWNNKQDTLVSGTNIKTINGNSIMGSGNLVIDPSYSAGTGIEITEENVINNTITSYDDLTDLPTIPSKTSELLNDSGYVTNEELSEVAFTGSYVSLSNTPTVVSDFINDANYVDMSFIWNMLPKLTSSASSINFTPTVANAPLKVSLNPSTLSQASTPSPSSPQDIHMTTGSNTIIVSNSDNTISQEADIDLGSIEYCKIGDYSDRIFKNVSSDPDYDSEKDEGAWYIKKNIAKVTLDGTQNVSSTSYSDLFYITSGNLNITYIDGGKCNYFGFVSNDSITGNSGANTNLSNNQMAFRLGGTKDRLYIKSNEYADNTAFQTWLSTHNTTVYYVLATPTYTKITDEDLILELENLGSMVTYNEQTNISQTNADLPFIITAETVKSLVNE